MSEILLITNAFPFLPGEQFIETEIKYLAGSSNQVTILPLAVEGEARAIPSNIKLDTRLAFCNKVSLKSVFRLIFSKYLYLEIFFKPKVLCSFYKLKKTLYYIYAGEAIAHELMALVKTSQNKNKLVYCYWANQSAFAAAIVKEKIPSLRAVSRCHRYDLYREGSYGGFMPMDKKFLNCLDAIFPCSRNGADYLAHEYNIIDRKIHIARLGTHDYGAGIGFNEDGVLHVVSCSYVTPVKRLHLIVDALALLEEGQQIMWTHIGGGPQLNILKIKSKEKLKTVSVIWKGEIENEEVISFYKTHKIDCFVNVSSSEGIPVSIMEATSFGIPIVAVDVGGVSEIVSQRNGKLVDKDSSAQDIAEAVVNICQRNTVKFRNEVRSEWNEQYNADRNYRVFLPLLSES